VANGKKLVSSVSRVSCAAGGKNKFSSAVKPMTLVLTSLDCICKPEVEIHQNRKY